MGTRADTLRRLRHERSLTVAQLAREAAVSRLLIAALEKGHPIAVLDDLTRLAHALGTEPEWLISRQPDASTPDDVGTFCALITDRPGAQAHDLAVALEWPLARLQSAARMAARDLSRVGLTLARDANEAYAIRPSQRHVDPDVRRRLARRARRASYTPQQVAAAIDIARQTSRGGTHLDTCDEKGIAELVRDGILTSTPHCVALTDDTRHSLELALD